jgi:hypothetical protein
MHLIGLTLRGIGSYTLMNTTIRDVAWADGHLPPPAAVVALGGIPSRALDAPGWSDGLLVNGVHLADIGVPGYLLDGSSGTFVDCTFDQVADFELFRQNCEGVEEPVQDGSVEDNGCGGGRQIEPLLRWLPDLVSQEQ